MGAIDVCFEVEGNTVAVLDIASQAILNTQSGSARGMTQLNSPISLPYCSLNLLALIDFTPLTNEVIDLPVGTSRRSQFCRNITILQDTQQENLENFMVRLTSNSSFVAVSIAKSVAMVNILGESK
jgi:hypothetical protein